MSSNHPRWAERAVSLVSLPLSLLLYLLYLALYLPMSNVPLMLLVLFTFTHQPTFHTLTPLLRILTCFPLLCTLRLLRHLPQCTSSSNLAIPSDVHGPAPLHLSSLDRSCNQGSLLASISSPCNIANLLVLHQIHKKQ